MNMKMPNFNVNVRELVREAGSTFNRVVQVHNR